MLMHNFFLENILYKSELTITRSTEKLKFSKSFKRLLEINIVTD